MNQTCFQHFKTNVDQIALPDKFNFPFYYKTHPLSQIAAEEIQEHLTNQKKWEHNFGLEENKKGLTIGKMFGVMVVRTNEGQLGYLAAFSGKLANKNHHDIFVPPVYDMLRDDGYFKSEEIKINEVTLKLEAIQQDDQFLHLQAHYDSLLAQAKEQLSYEKIRVKIAKKERADKREKLKATLSQEEYAKVLKELQNESLMRQWYVKDLGKKWEARINQAKSKMAFFEEQISKLKDQRKDMSNALQGWLFDQYKFLNTNGLTKNLLEIFKDHPLQRPPAGAGECAAPKLLQYAFLNGLEPICLAEFWWGSSPKSEVRKHKHFYPACRGKCQPILKHMLDGMEVDPNPMLSNPAEGKNLETIYEDEYLCAINKPAEFLSVPGKNIHDSVQLRMQVKYPEATGPLLAHRLDMSTSGIMLISKDKNIHRHLQKQFIQRTVKKRYVALLEGIIEKDEGSISLPLRVDIDDRPRQLVCTDYGKEAVTEYKVLKRGKDRTLVHFFPKTGRTHQLRVHAAHPDGLNAPIVGDDLYGLKAQRLHLHAEEIEFIHPSSKELVKLSCPAPF